MTLGRLIQVTLWPLAMIPMEMKRSDSALMNYVLSVRQIMYSYFSFFIIKWHTHTHTHTHTRKKKSKHTFSHTHTLNNTRRTSQDAQIQYLSLLHPSPTTTQNI